MDLKVPALVVTHVGVNMMPHEGISGFSVCYFKNRENYTPKTMLKEH